MGRIETYNNQRIITVNKAPTDKQHLYTANNLEAIDEASGRLLSAGGFKLYIYLAKNQNKYIFALSSKDFMSWSGLGKTAYTTAFKELIKEGYLIQDSKQGNLYHFYDKSQKQEELIDNVFIDYTGSGSGFVY